MLILWDYQYRIIKTKIINRLIIMRKIITKIFFKTKLKNKNQYRINFYNRSIIHKTHKYIEISNKIIQIMIKIMKIFQIK